MSYKDPVFEAVEVGETFGPLTFKTDEHYARSAMFSLDDYSAWYQTAENDFGRRLVPSAAIARDQVALFMTKYNPNTVVGLHQTEEIWFSAPVPFDAEITLTGRYIDKYERRGKGYTQLECHAHDADGNLLVRQISTEIMQIPQGIRMGEGGSTSDAAARRVTGVVAAGRGPAVSAGAGLSPGTPLPPRTKRAHQDQMSVFSGADLNRHNIHTDDRVALAAGFRAPLAQGMMTTCWMSQMLGDFFGPSWLTSGWIKTSYLQPVFAGDELTLKAAVVGMLDDDRLELEVWSVNREGAMTAAGWASARIHN
jgi:acyl dehydratase